MRRKLTLFLIASAVGCTGTPSGTPTPISSTASQTQMPSSTSSPSTQPDPVASATLVWTQGGLPTGLARRIAGLAGVTHSVSVVDGTVWLTGSRTVAGKEFDRSAGGMAMPLDLAGAAPADLAAFFPATDQSLISDLAKGQAILGATSAALRHIGAGGVLEFGSRSVRVAGVVPDAVVGGHELFVSRAEAAALGINREQYVLLQAPGGVSQSRIRALVPAGTLMRIRGPGEAHFLRQADAVLPPVMMKAAFGEFAADPILLPGEWMSMAPDWQAEHIVSAPVPILGTARCNVALIPQLRAALTQVFRRGLASLIRPGDYGGCFAARVIPGSPGEALSAHAWGAAIDINVSTNQVGASPHQGPRLVAIFKRWGFTWGGNWMRPDGMHFEFQCFPPGLGPSGLPAGLTCPPGGAIWPPT